MMAESILYSRVPKTVPEYRVRIIMFVLAVKPFSTILADMDSKRQPQITTFSSTFWAAL
jgi:hypothetical protein